MDQIWTALPTWYILLMAQTSMSRASPSRIILCSIYMKYILCRKANYPLNMQNRYYIYNSPSFIACIIKEIKKYKRHDIVYHNIQWLESIKQKDKNHKTKNLHHCSNNELKYLCKFIHQPSSCTMDVSHCSQQHTQCLYLRKGMSWLYSLIYKL